jgi:hypothetical protein
MGIRHSVLMAVALSSASCVSTPAATGQGRQPAARPAADRYVTADGVVIECQMEMPTGSHLRERVCHPAQPSPDERRQVDELLHRPQQSGRSEKGGS